MYFSKLLNNITKNSITSIYKQNNNYNIRQKHIFYQLLQNQNNKNIPNKLPLCKSILPYTPILPYKKDTKLNDTQMNDTKLINNESLTELNSNNIQYNNTNDYLKIIIISSISGLISYSGLYIYLFINDISSLFSL